MDGAASDATTKTQKDVLDNKTVQIHCLLDQLQSMRMYIFQIENLWAIRKYLGSLLSFIVHTLWSVYLQKQSERDREDIDVLSSECNLKDNSISEIERRLSNQIEENRSLKSQLEALKRQQLSHKNMERKLLNVHIDLKNIREIGDVIKHDIKAFKVIEEERLQSSLVAWDRNFMESIDELKDKIQVYGILFGEMISGKIIAQINRKPVGIIFKSGHNKHGLSVRRVNEDSEVYAQGVRKGDTVMLLNDVSLSMLPRSDAAKVFRDAVLPFELTFFRGKNPADFKSHDNVHLASPKKSTMSTDEFLQI